MARRRGSIRKVRDDAWTIAPKIPPHPLTGERRVQTKRVIGTREDAEKALTEWQGRIDRGEYVAVSDDTMRTLLLRWLEDDCRPRVKPGTYDDYAATIRVHLLPRLGHLKAQALTPADVHRAIAGMRRETGARSVQLALLRLKSALEWAVAVELVPRNVAAKVAPPKYEAEPARAMTHAELRDFLTAAREDHYWPLWLVYATTGLRRGEGLGLRWEDVDLARARLRVHQAVSLVKGDDGVERPCIQEPKSRAARRTLDLDQETVRSLTALHEVVVDAVHVVTAKVNAHDLIFCTAIGTLINPANLYRNFTRICAHAGLDADWNIHHLRHTHVSHLLDAGVPIVEVSRRIGHASVSITLSTYSHWIQDSQSRSVAAIEAALFRGLPELE